MHREDEILEQENPAVSPEKVRQFVSDDGGQLVFAQFGQQIAGSKNTGRRP